MKRTMENLQGDLADVVGASQFVPSNDPIQFHPDLADDFGHPFTFPGDPLLHNLDPTIHPGFLYNDQETGIFGISNHDKKTPGSPRDLKALPNPPTTMLLSNNLISSNNIGCLVERSGTGLQISSPRNTAIKRRKNQARKVVCIPAVAPANSKSNGEIVPSDLWAWRKYGQKPIKGSPYPRGYYRCSSSKGCLARKQVERSRTDSNMLVITYTWEHNHQLPTQRNALAGSTRPQPSKNCVSKNHPSQKLDNNPKKKQKMEVELDPGTNSDSVKVEEMDQEFDSRLEMEEAYFEEVGFAADKFEDSFFAELGEIDHDPLDLVFMQGLCSDGREDSGLGAFGGFYDWATNGDATVSSDSTTTTTSTSYVEAGNDLLKYDPKPD